MDQDGNRDARLSELAQKTTVRREYPEFTHFVTVEEIRQVSYAVTADSEMQAMDAVAAGRSKPMQDVRMSRHITVVPWIESEYCQ